MRNQTEHKEHEQLVQRYHRMKSEGRTLYLDVDELLTLFDYFDGEDDLPEASRVVELGMQIHPDSIELMVCRARLQMYDGRFQQSIAYLDEHFSGYDFEAYLVRIACQLELGNDIKAKQLSDEMLANETDFRANTLSELGAVYADSDRFEQARTYLEESIRLEPNNFNGLADLVYAYEMLGRFDEAIETTNRLLDEDPYFARAWLNLGKLYTTIGKYQQAIDALDFALSIEEDDYMALTLKAHCLHVSRQYEEALEIYIECLKKYPSDAQLLSPMIDIYIEMWQPALALIALETWGQQTPHDAEFVLKKVDALLRLNRLPDAERFAMELRTAPVEAYLPLCAEGEICLQKQDYARAEQLFIKALALSDNDSYVGDRLVATLIAAQNYGEALHRLGYLEATADDPYVVYYRMAQVYFETADHMRFAATADRLTLPFLLSLAELYLPEKLTTTTDDERMSPSFLKQLLLSGLEQ